MRMPRMRFTVRTMMAVVAVMGVSLGTAIEISGLRRTAASLRAKAAFHRRCEILAASQAATAERCCSSLRRIVDLQQQIDAVGSKMGGIGDRLLRRSAVGIDESNARWRCILAGADEGATGCGHGLGEVVRGDYRRILGRVPRDSGRGFSKRRNGRKDRDIGKRSGSLSERNGGKIARGRAVRRKAYASAMCQKYQKASAFPWSTIATRPPEPK